MQKSQKEKIAKAVVALDESIASSNGLADFLSKIIAHGFDLVFGSDVSESKESEDK